MPTLSELALFEDIFRLENDTPAEAVSSSGDISYANIQAQQLANRTRYLLNLVMSIPEFADYTFYITANDPDGTIAGLAGTQAGKLFRVAQGYSANASFIYYLNQAGVAKKVAILPSQVSVNSLTELISKSATETIFETLRDEEGGVLRQYTSDKLADIHHEVSSNAQHTLLAGDKEGAALILADDNEISIGPLVLKHSLLPGIRVVDPEGGILQDLSDPGLSPIPELQKSPLDSGIFLGSRVLAGFEGEMCTLHIPSMVSDRLSGREIQATLAATATASQVSSQNVISFKVSDFGDEAVLNLRSSDSFSDRTGAAIKMVSVPSPAATDAPVIKILMIGDSIGNNQGPFLLEKYLSAAGYTPKFIGTLNSSAHAISSNLPSGPLAECRSGWMSGDFTGALIDRFGFVQPGDETNYMALGKSVKTTFNPFLRAATSSDSPDIIRNNLVFDCSFYQTRFALETPDIVIYSLGTNDVRWASESTIYDDVLSNDLLIMRQVRAAWPNAKIIRMLPGTAMEPVRNELWATRYTKVLNAMNVAMSTLGDTKAMIAPTWALVNHDSGYPPAFADVDPLSGFGAMSWSDPVHPSGASRHSLYKSLAPFVVASYLNLI